MQNVLLTASIHYYILKINNYLIEAFYQFIYQHYLIS